jgi:hypothetical protein
MRDEPQESTWFFLFVLACLFVLSATAPRAWEQIARKQTCSEMLPPMTAGANEPDVADRRENSWGASQDSHRLAAQDARYAETLPGTNLPQAAAPAGPVVVDRLPKVASDFRLQTTSPPYFDVPADPELICPKTPVPAPRVDAPAPPPSSSLADAPYASPPALDRLAERPSENQPEGFTKPSLPALARSRTTPRSPSLELERRLNRTESPEPSFEPALDRGSNSAAERRPAELTPPERHGQEGPATKDSGNLPDSLADEPYRWQMPQRLLEQLAKLDEEPSAAAWASRVRSELDRLGATIARSAERTSDALQNLETLHAQAEALAAGLEGTSTATTLRRAAYSLRRRLDLWRTVLPHLGRDEAELVQAKPNTEPLSIALAEVDQMTRDSAHGRAWREYLLLDSLQQAADDDRPQQRQRLAKQIIRRLARSQLDGQQRRFVATGPLAKLRSELIRWAAEPAAPAEVLQSIEQYEVTGTNSDARRVAEARLWLSLSTDPELQRLSQVIEAHYRNANFRLAVTDELINRLIPEREPEQQPVRDIVLGNLVHGQSTTNSRVAFRTVPDPHRLMLALEVTGEIDSLTQSTSGPATFYNQSQSTYTARKLVEVGPWGMRLQPAEVRANNSTRLRGLRTDLDAIPILGLLVQDVARSHHRQKKDAIRHEIERKVAMKAKQRIDEEADRRLNRLTERLHQRVIEPLEALELDPALVSARTTDRRIIMRLRLAGQTQLGGHTPRPRARSDSLASLQLHESAMNNMLQKLDLDGKRFTLAALQQRVADRLERPEMFDPAEARDDVEIAFAPENAIRVSCDDGQLEIRLAIAWLKAGSRSWRNFEVQARYTPRIDGLEIALHREEIVRLRGRLSTGSQIALRGIFTSTFSKDRPWNIMPKRLINESQFSDLKVTQLVIEDGWIGVSLGHQDAPEMPAMARR